MTVDDAEKAVDAGASAIVISNHGGRFVDTLYFRPRGLAASQAPDGHETVQFRIGNPNAMRFC